MKRRCRELFDKSRQHIRSVEASAVDTDVTGSAASTLFGFLGRAAITVVLSYCVIRPSARYLFFPAALSSVPLGGCFWRWEVMQVRGNWKAFVGIPVTRKRSTQSSDEQAGFQGCVVGRSAWLEETGIGGGNIGSAQVERARGRHGRT
jgi:hypothetical protein